MSISKKSWSIEGGSSTPFNFCGPPVLQELNLCVQSSPLIDSGAKSRAPYLETLMSLQPSVSVDISGLTG